MKEEEQSRQARERMVRYQIEQRGIHNSRLLAVMRTIPREWFIPPPLRKRAYDDGPIPIGWGQTISQPYMVAVMTDLLSLREDENVLEVGTGSGYQAAVLAKMTRSVHTIERHPGLADRAQEILAEMGFYNVYVHTGDGTFGWPPAAPYQAILVTAAAPEIPAPLIEQLDEDGRLVIPIGGSSGQELERWRKVNGNLRREGIFSVSFVPLRGQFGWGEDEWREEKPPRVI